MEIFVFDKFGAVHVAPTEDTVTIYILLIDFFSLSQSQPDIAKALASKSYLASNATSIIHALVPTLYYAYGADVFRFPSSVVSSAPLCQSFLCEKELLDFDAYSDAEKVASLEQLLAWIGREIGDHLTHTNDHQIRLRFVLCRNKICSSFT